MLSRDESFYDRSRGAARAEEMTRFVPCDGPEYGYADREIPMLVGADRARGLARDTPPLFTTNNPSSFEQSLIRNIVDIASKGAGFLLNIGSADVGSIPQSERARLAAITTWLQVNGESIYGTRPAPFNRLGFDGRCLRSFNTLYVHVFAWPGDSIFLPGLTTKALYAESVADGERLRIAQTKQGLTIGQPFQVDPFDTVLRVRLSDKPALNGYEIPISIDACHGATLDLTEARVHDSAGSDEAGGSADCDKAALGRRCRVSWPVRFSEPGRYLVYMTCANGSSIGPASYRISCGESEIEGLVAPTDSWTDFRNVLAGVIDVQSSSEAVLCVGPRHAGRNGSFPRIRAVGLSPVAAARPAPHGTVFLIAELACGIGSTFRVESGSMAPYVGNWIDARDYLAWEAVLPSANEYDAWIEQACPNDIAGSTYTFGTAAGSIECKVVGTGGWSCFQTQHLGKINLRAGAQIVTVKPLNKAGVAVMNFRKIILRPSSPRAR
jgi:hypothetical protein